MTIRPFHAGCVADAANGLSRTCDGCIAEARRRKGERETVTGYLLCVAALAARTARNQAARQQ